MSTKKKSGLFMKAPVDLSTLFDILLLSLPRDTVLDPGKRVGNGLPVSVSTGAMMKLFDGPAYTTELSKLLSLYASGKIGEEWRTRDEKIKNFARWEPGVVVERRDSYGSGSEVVSNNGGVLVFNGGKSGYAFEYLPRDGRAFLRPSPEHVDIEIEGFPIPQSIVENLLVLSLWDIRGVTPLSHFGFLFRYVIETPDRVESAGCADDVAQWCADVVAKYVKEGTVLVSTVGPEEGTYKRVETVANLNTLVVEGGVRVLRTDITNIAFFGGKLA